MLIRSEKPADQTAIRLLVDEAFKSAEHSSQTEGATVDALRQADALTISLVAEVDHTIVGHIAFSPVLIEDLDWFGFGPVSVLPGRQCNGIGTKLINEGLRLLKSRDAAGCVVLGDPEYYSRFGFTSDHALRYGDAPPEYFQSLVLLGDLVEGEVSYHEGFEAN